MYSFKKEEQKLFSGQNGKVLLPPLPPLKGIIQKQSLIGKEAINPRRKMAWRSEKRRDFRVRQIWVCLVCDLGQVTQLL